MVRPQGKHSREMQSNGRKWNEGVGTQYRGHNHKSQSLGERRRTIVTQHPVVKTGGGCNKSLSVLPKYIRCLNRVLGDERNAGDIDWIRY